MSIKQNGSMIDEKRKDSQKRTGNGNISGENFDPPDGGWGWIIVIAAGFSNVSAYRIVSAQY